MKVALMETMVINGEEWVKKSSIVNQEVSRDYVIIKTYSAGVHAGYLHSRNGKEVVLRNTRRIWYWDGAFTLSQLSLSGSSKPENCKLSVVIPEITLLEAIEIIPVTEKAKQIIESIKAVEK